MLTVLESELQDAKAAEQARLEKERIAKELKLSELRKAGVSSPFVLFNELGKMDYQTAVAKAKDNDPQAYYWLSYYFAKGEGVERDGDVAGRCLEKAASLGNPDANYAKGLLLEKQSFGLPYDNYLGYFTVDYSIYIAGWRRGHQLDVNSDADVASVVELYNRAVSGGLTFATNDIARFKQKISVKRGEISKAESLKCATSEVLESLGLAERTTKHNAQKKAADEKAQKNAAEESARKAEEEKRQKVEADKKAEQEFWATWPKEVSGFAGDILIACEKELGTVVEHKGSNCVWSSTCGKSYISRNHLSHPWCNRDDGIWTKYDKDGKLVKVGQAKNFSEYVWMTNRAERMTVERRRSWAEEHNMSYEEAVKKYEVYLEKQPSLVRRMRGQQGTPTRAMGSLRERRAIREAELAAEKAEREKEREAQRAQLLKIQEELNKQRSGKE